MKRRLKIAQLSPYYYPVIGGVEKVCQYLSEGLAARGHEVHVLTANRNHAGQPDLRLSSRETVNGVTVHRFNSWFSLGHHGFFPGIVRPLCEIGFDIIHSHCYRQPQGELALWVSRAKSIPVLLHVHGGFSPDTFSKKLIYGWYDRLAQRGRCNRFDRFIVLSDADGRSLERLGVDRRRIVTIVNAADRDSFRSYDSRVILRMLGIESRRIILFMGILGRCKRPDLLISALPGVVKDHLDTILVLAGPDAGELRSVLRLAEDLGVAEHVLWVGSVQGEVKHALYEACEFLVLPSDVEAYGLVLLEAMAHGKPVVTTTAAGAAAAVAENRAGIVFEKGDVGALTESIRCLLDDPVQRSELGANAHTLAERDFTTDRAVDAIESMYYGEIENHHE